LSGAIFGAQLRRLTRPEALRLDRNSGIRFCSSGFAAGSTNGIDLRYPQDATEHLGSLADISFFFDVAKAVAQSTK